MTKHQPKGGMCVNCISRNKDCSQLDFSKMPVIESCKVNGAKIVACKEYTKGSQCT